MSTSGPRSIPFSGFIRWAACLGASLTLMHCAARRETVRIPPSDGTPPFVALDAVGAGHTLVLSVGRGAEQVELLPRDSIVLIGLSEDADGGVKDLSLVGNALVTCKDMKTGKSRTRKTGFTRKSVPGADRSTRAPMRRSNRFVLRSGDLAALCRGPGLAFAGAVGQASAATANFNGGHASSPRLEFRLVGGWVPDPAAMAPEAPAKAPIASRPATEIIQTAMGSRHGAGEPAAVTSEIPKPVGFMPEGGVGGTEYCPRDAFPTPPDCVDNTPVPFLTR
jgi:hypothetical protein